MKEDNEKDKMQVLELMEDGTLVVEGPEWQKVGRVLVVGSNEPFCKLFYADGIALFVRKKEWEEDEQCVCKKD